MYFVIFFLYHMKPKLGMFETRIHRQERETKPTLVLQTPNLLKIFVEFCQLSGAVRYLVVYHSHERNVR